MAQRAWTAIECLPQNVFFGDVDLALIYTGLEMLRQDKAQQPLRCQRTGDQRGMRLNQECQLG